MYHFTMFASMSIPVILVLSSFSLIMQRYEVKIGSTQEQPSAQEDIEAETNPNSPTSVHIVCEVRAQLGSKMVLVQSPVVLENHTDLDIEIGLDIPPVIAHPTRAKQVNPNMTRPRPLVPLATIPPHSERAPFPLSRVSTAKLRLRPVTAVNTKVPNANAVKVPRLGMPISSASASADTLVGVVPGDEPQNYGWSINIGVPGSMQAGDDVIVRCGTDFFCRVVAHRKTPNLILKVSIYFL